jgi:hypothetical protein
VTGLFVDPITNGTHGLNEQVGVKELYDSKEYLYRRNYPGRWVWITQPAGRRSGVLVLR